MNIEFTIKNEKVLLRADEANYELCWQVKQTDPATGKAVAKWVPYKFFATLEAALNRIMDMKIRASDAKTLAELKADIEFARDEVCRTWQIGAA